MRGAGKAAFRLAVDGPDDGRGCPGDGIIVKVRSVEAFGGEREGDRVVVAVRGAAVEGIGLDVGRRASGELVVDLIGGWGHKDEGCDHATAVGMLERCSDATIVLLGRVVRACAAKSGMNVCGRSVVGLVWPRRPWRKSTHHVSCRAEYRADILIFLGEQKLSTLTSNHLDIPGVKGQRRDGSVALVRRQRRPVGATVSEVNGSVAARGHRRAG